MLQTIVRNAIGLGLFAMVTAGLIALTQSATSDRIAEQQRQAQASALWEIVPRGSHDNELLDDTFPLPDDPRLGHRGKPAKGWVARKEGEVLGVILPVVAREGYSGDILLLVGIDRQGEILGVRVTAHQETPGLGDGIERRKSDWITSFNGRSKSNTPAEAFKVKPDGGEFDAFSGATITPRAVVAAVRDSLAVFEEQRSYLLNPVTPSPGVANE
ncbi:MAG: electron transport complex subunit RsxG [Halomonadaceae bacterium]|nr:MAG: electron transport complex subunit RsxG [Halomonadaceae bacterium]